MSKQVFQILWPSHNVLTLCNVIVIQTFIISFADDVKSFQILDPLVPMQIMIVLMYHQTLMPPFELYRKTQNSVILSAEPELRTLAFPSEAEIRSCQQLHLQ